MSPQAPTGGTVPYLLDIGQEAFDASPNQLPPLTKAIRETWSPHTAHPVASAAAVAAMFAAIYALETRLIALESA